MKVGELNFPKKKVIVKELYQIMMKEENLFSLKGETHVEANVIFANLKKYLSLRFKLALLRLYRKLLGTRFFYFLLTFHFLGFFIRCFDFFSEID